MQTLKNIYHLFISFLAVLYYRYPAKNLIVIGVTGTDGKTTTSNMIYHMLTQAGKKAGLVSTLGAKIGDQTYDIGLHVTTPSSLTLQKLLRDMVKAGCQYAVVEATSHGLDQNRLFGCNFSYGVLTNITHEHLDYHGTFEAYVAAKARLFRGIKKAFINCDGPWYEAIKPYLTSSKTTTYGLSTEADVNPSKFPISLKISGDYNLANAMASVSIGRELGVDDTAIRLSLEAFEGLEGRLDEVTAGQSFKVYVDFAHTPHATEQVLTALRKQTNGRVIAMFGCAGLRDKAKRPITGEVAARNADIAIITADDPATERVDDIIAQIIPGCLQAGAKQIEPEDLKARSDLNNQHYFVIIPDRKEAIAFACTIAHDNDVVALLSKGHQKSFSLGKEEIPWDEKNIAYDVLKGLGYGN